MGFIILILILLLTNNSFCIQYKVEEKDTLWSISKKFGVNIEIIEKLNEITVLKSGQVLFIPEKIIEYKVENGDSLIGISRKFNTPLKYIIILNNFKDEKIYPGQIIKIPVSENKNVENKPEVSQNSPYLTHIVKSGETLYSISRIYSVTIDDILKWNNKKEATLFAGEKLKIYSTIKEEKNFSQNRRDFYFPLKSKQIVENITKSKRGYVFNLKETSNIYSINDGIIEFVGHINGYDKVVIIKSGEYKIVYGYLSEVFVEKGKDIKKGEIVGKVDYHSFVNKITFYIEIRKGKNLLDINQIFRESDLFAKK